MGASRLEQTNALFRKNLAIQRRACKTNCCLILFPLLLCSVIGGMQIAINRALSTEGPTHFDCGCSNVSIDENALGGMECPDGCPLPRAPKWPPVLQIPVPEYRAVKDGLFPFSDLPDASCRAAGSCAATFLVTGGNQSFVGSVMDNMLPAHNASVNLSADVSALAEFVLAADGYSSVPMTYFYGPGASTFLQNKCVPNLTLSFAFQDGNQTETRDVQCTEGLMLWRNSSWLISDELYRGYYQGNNKNKTNEIVAAYDFLSSDQANFNLVISYNSTSKFDDYYEADIPLILNQAGSLQVPRLVQVPRLTNMASNAYLHLRGNGLKMSFDYVKEMPRSARYPGQFDISPLIGQLPFVWTMELLFPVILTILVYEKQKKLRIMMKMHGLGDLPYWTISYCYFLLLSLLYVLSFILFGSVLGLRFFRQNNYGIQFVFYFTYMNLQISFAFLMATSFSSVRTATVLGYFYIFVSGLLGEFLFRPYVEDILLSRSWITLMELLPAFSLYRIVYEFSQAALLGNYMASSGMQWIDMSDPKNGMASVLTIMVLEWLLFLLLAFYLDHFGSLQNGLRKATAHFRSRLDRNCFQAAQQQNVQLQEFRGVEMERADVIKEREIVDQLLQESNSSYSVICDNIKKVYSGKDGNAEKFAVRGISLSLSHGQCFGVLGPNGAGKTTLINMLTGFTKPTSGTAYIEGMDIRADMGRIYTGIGVCPQDDLLWETLTGREHLMFYGRLKKLKGATLAEAIEQSLRSVRLFAGGVADKLVGKYSGGMKRRLSVAISLIGDPKVVFMDEPSSGLDPASRKDLWNAVKSAKQNMTIILTTHSMEEAEVLCDRIGIIADGSLQCIGNSKELKDRYGGSCVLTVTTAAGNEEEDGVERLVQSISPAANRVYRISGTQKFNMPKQGMKISEVFQAMEHAKSRLNILAWGLADTTLEDVFIRVAKESDISTVT
ncbi:ABC transporter A family member 8-like [Phragmites australis]|uniref:ABC transporter A family member 8-like n=1 Tax=Phragmites australis TaxID=29695 RepID=UPI002D76AD80|nr:ABC transporter A family member 8-like [Phragmites australis]